MSPWWNRLGRVLQWGIGLALAVQLVLTPIIGGWLVVEWLLEWLAWPLALLIAVLRPQDTP